MRQLVVARWLGFASQLTFSGRLRALATKFIVENVSGERVAALVAACQPEAKAIAVSRPNDCMGGTIPRTRAVSRDGVNAAQTFFEHNGCVFQEVARQNDFGKDAYVDLSIDRTITHLCVAVQIKSGKSYRRPDGTYEIPIENHGENWRRSTVPMLGLVYDPEGRLLRWVDLTGYLQSNPGHSGGTVPISREAVLDAASLRTAFMGAVERYADAGIALALLSDFDDLQEDAVFDAWALGRKDARYLILLRRLILDLRPRAVRRVIVALSHATPHPDIFWTEDNWIPPDTKARAAASFRWSPLERTHAEHNWRRGLGPRTSRPISRYARPRRSRFFALDSTSPSACCWRGERKTRQAELRC